MLAQILAPFGFGERAAVVGRASIADLFGAKGRSGLYVLDFADGALYAGLTTDVVKRYGQHRQAHGDIAGLRFAPCPEARQAAEERKLIGALEGAGFALRNIALMSVVTGERDLDALIPPDDQEDWTAGLELLDASERVNDPALRARYKTRMAKFDRTLGCKDAVKLLRLHIVRTIPRPRLTELSFWCLSCLPTYTSRSGAVLLSRVNLNMMEVASVLADEEETFMTFHVAESPFQEDYEDHTRTLVDIGYELSDHKYVPGGADQLNIVAPSFDHAVLLMNDPTFVRAARTMNMRLMRKGPSYYSRSHSLLLSDRILGR